MSRSVWRAVAASVLMFLGATAPLALATPWELTIQLSGPSASSMQIQVCETQSGNVVGTYWSYANQYANDFTVDFNGQAGADVSLTPGVTYTLTFVGWDKRCYIAGDMPPGQPNYDDMFHVNGTNNTVTHLSGPWLQDCWGFPAATCGTPPPPPPLVLALSVVQTTPIGSKTRYTLQGFANNGVGGYTFSWSNATMSTGATVNPSLATRTLLNTQQATVSCTVTSQNGTLTQSIVIGGGNP